MTIGQSITYYRRMQVLTKTELARRVGVSDSTVVYYENGRLLPTLRRQIAIAHALGIQVRQLWSGTPDSVLIRLCKSKRARKDNQRCSS